LEQTKVILWKGTLNILKTYRYSKLNVKTTECYVVFLLFKVNCDWFLSSRSKFN